MLGRMDEAPVTGPVTALYARAELATTPLPQGALRSIRKSASLAKVCEDGCVLPTVKLLQSGRSSSQIPSFYSKRAPPNAQIQDTLVSSSHQTVYFSCKSVKLVKYAPSKPPVRTRGVGMGNLAVQGYSRTSKSTRMARLEMALNTKQMIWSLMVRQGRWHCYSPATHSKMS